MLDVNREAAYLILLEMERESSFSNLAINNYFRNTKKNLPDSPDLVRRLVYGVTENRLYLDYFLDKILSKGLNSLNMKVQTILRLGSYQLEKMDSVPDYAAISTSVDLAKKYTKGFDKLVNASLRGWQRKKKEIQLPDENKLGDYLSIKYSCRREIVDILLAQRGEEAAEKILEKTLEPGVLTLRVNTYKSDIEEVTKELTGEGLHVEASSLSPRILKVEGDEINIPKLPCYKEGRVSIQSEESCLIADSCEAKPGDKILDVCAAPGGKTLAMAEAMGNTGEIVACDIYATRLDLIKRNADRLGVSILEYLEHDGREPLDKSYDGYFDIILVDAPCSGLGVMRKKPEIKQRVPNIEELQDVQKSILDNVKHNLRTSGRLIYSTCSLDKRENTEVINDFLTRNDNYSLVYERELLPHIDDIDGFYVAVLRKEKCN